MSKKKHLSIKSMLIILIAAFLILATLLFIGVYRVITQQVLQSNVETMSELTQHDRNSVLNSIDLRYDSLYAIVDSLKAEKPQTLDETRELLQKYLPFVSGAKNLCLMSDDGILYRNSGLYMEDAIAREFCDTHDGQFVATYNKAGVTIDNQREMLIQAVPAQFSFDEKNITHLIAILDLRVLQSELKVDSFDGEGFSSVIDEDGYYIVNVSAAHSYLTRDNFYKDLQNAELESYKDPEELRKTILSLKEPLSVHFSQNGEQNVMVVTPLDRHGWYFLSTVPESVFDGQSRAIYSIVFTLVGVLMLAMIGAAIMLLYRRKQAMQLEFADERAAHLETIEQQHEQLEKEHAALEEALDMANAANRSKTTFLNNMSHDIRTPMNAIIGYTGMAASHIDNKEQVQGYLTKIGQSSNHLLSLINDVLDMSRIESGKMTLNEKPESLSEILHALRDIVQADIHAKELEFFMDTTDVHDEEVICDKLRLNQILLNVISNSIKYTPAGGMVSVRLTEKAVKANGYGVYEFRIKDTGMGMNEEFLKTIYDPFTRVNSSTVSGIQGTGLGMAITKNIVDLYGGTIQVESEEHKGTEVIITLDFKLQTEHKEPERIVELEGLRGLVADDDISACKSISRMLKDIGIRSDWCASGKEAVIRTEEAYQEGDLFKVYIIDWLMPDMNGIETARRIRHIVGDAAPIIILTAYDWTDIEFEAREAGVTGFISKPLFASDLRVALMKCIGKEEKVEEQKVSYDFTGKKILLVEDNEMNREIATELLEEDGFVVDTAEDGTIAVQKMENAKPGDYDLILMDVQMPIMNGYEATRRIREMNDPAIANITILAMTANAFEEDRQSAIAAGMNDHLTKPVDVRKLKDTLVKYLR